MAWNKAHSCSSRRITRNHADQTGPGCHRHSSHHGAPAAAHRLCKQPVHQVRALKAAAVPNVSSSNSSGESHAPVQSELIDKAATRARWGDGTTTASAANVAGAGAAIRGDIATTKAPEKSAGAPTMGTQTVVVDVSLGRDVGLEPFRSLVAGHRFLCTMCGKCCTGEGEIWVGPKEVDRIAAHLNLSPDGFLAAYTKSYSKHRGWRMLRTREGGACIFLGADNKCSIHTVRPSQCSTYPWWPELMERAEWDWEKANVCEGFDHPEAGPLDEEEAAKQLREANKMTQLRLLASTRPLTSQVEKWAKVVLVPDEQSNMDEH